VNEALQAPLRQYRLVADMKKLLFVPAFRAL